MTAPSPVDTELHINDAGTGPPLVLLHGFPMDGRVFAAQSAAAASGDLAVRLRCPDLPGFGLSKLPHPAPDVLEVPVMADLLAAAIGEMGEGPVVCGGIAIGGYIAIELASRYPELVTSLILMGTKAGPDPTRMAPAREAVARLALDEGARAVATDLVDKPLGPSASDKTRQRLYELIADADPRAIAALARGLARRPDPAPALRELTLPVLVIAGTDDSFTAIDDARAPAAACHDARIVEIDGCGHVAPLETPAEVTAAMASFLAEKSP